MRWLLAILGLAVIAILAFRMLATRQAERHASVAAPAYVDSLGRPMTPPDQMSARTAYETAVALARAGMHTGSIPYFRRALDLRPDLWQVHCDYAASVLNGAIEVHTLLGLPAPVSRSSVERVAVVREAFAHLAVAERLATDPTDRARVVALRAQHLALWGFGWDALTGYLKAASIKPGREPYFSEAAQQARLLRDPVTPGP